MSPPKVLEALDAKGGIVSMSEAPARVVFTTGFCAPLHRRRAEFQVAGEERCAASSARWIAKFPGLGETLEEETTVAIDGELYEIDFLRPIKPGAEVFFIPKIEGG